MAERIEFFLRHLDAAADVGSRSREWVHERFDFGQSARRALASYERLAAAGAPSRALNAGGPVA
jgi:hypothetical protein